MFFDEIIDEYNLHECSNKFFITQFQNKAIFVQGKYNINYFSSVKIILSFQKQKLFIYGKNLELKDMDNLTLNITGQLLCVSSVEVSFE